ncbi:hypothetical protein [Synechococcus sp. RS9916]|uniref:hypothetical protein n=1 Tax=Synechococcus sp. RS9916 TaxID=221359 RepID=UPI0000E53594|nr:hypothetical protein [Synechococcus sp. RS9916]EAU74609.1 hypothetical protein RS9916_33917 [Synechococcus sp. RS9916]
MTELNTQAQIIELSDDQLELVEGGRSDVVNTLVSFVPYVGPANTISDKLGGPTIGDLF